MIRGLNHLTLAVREIDKSFSFYRDVLGFTPLLRHRIGAYFLAGDLWFCLEQDENRGAVPWPEYTHVAFDVAGADFAAMSERIRASGAEIWKENRSEGESIYFLDPDGHKLELHVGSWQQRMQSARQKPWNESLRFLTDDFVVKKIEHQDLPWVKSLKDIYFGGAEFIVTRGRKVYPVELPGFFAETAGGTRLGYLGYEVRDGTCEVVTLDATRKHFGIGTALLEALGKEARRQQWQRIWLLTTNDNLDAIRFYQKRGFSFKQVHKDAIAVSRRLKPSIPQIGNFGIPIRDEIELEMML